MSANNFECDSVMTNCQKNKVNVISHDIKICSKTKRVPEVIPVIHLVCSSLCELCHCQHEFQTLYSNFP